MSPKTTSEHALAVVKAAVSAVPIFGGPLGSLIDDYIPTSTSKRIDETLQMLACRLSELDDRLDLEAVDKEEFAELFKSAYLLMLRAHKAERQRAIANLLANVLLSPDDPDRLPYTELDHFARCLDALSIGALRCALEVYSPTRSLGPGRFGFRELAARFPEMDVDLLMGLMSELNSQNLIQLVVPQITLNSFQNYGIDRTGLGERFVSSLLAPVCVA